MLFIIIKHYLMYDLLTNISISYVVKKTVFVPIILCIKYIVSILPNKIKLYSLLK